jgi:hypothetical protein
VSHAEPYAVHDRDDTRLAAVDDLVVDTKTDAVACVMAVSRTKYSLRRPHGGLEWDAPLDRVRPATARELLAEQLRKRGLLSTPQRADAR